MLSRVSPGFWPRAVAGDVDAMLDDACVDTPWRNRCCGSPFRYLPGRVGGHPTVRGVSMLAAFWLVSINWDQLGQRHPDGKPCVAGGHVMLTRTANHV